MSLRPIFYLKKIKFVVFLNIMKLNELKDKKILILGFGKEGRDTLLFLKKLFPKKKIGIADQKFGKDYLDKIGDYDVIIKSPGIPFKKIPRPDVGKITTQTEIFFDNCLGQIVGITGTKGKSTTTSLIYDILKIGGLKAHLVGNIGKPVLNLLFSATPKDVYVYELSSFQLTNLKKSPHIAVLLNIYPEHMDYYRNFKEYINAKANIALHQKRGDFLVYNSTNKLVSQIASKSRAKIIPIKGEYYELDRNAARAVGELFKISNEKIEKAIKNFKPLPHRLELVGTFKGITFYDDAIATIPEATIAAINQLGDNVQTIMLGGYDRGIDFKNLAKAVLKSKIKNIILFPTTGEKIWQEILRQKHLVVSRVEPFFVNNMPDAVSLAYRNTEKGKICLLSCASASYSIFRDYIEKGDLFKKYVRQFAKTKWQRDH
ncbi:MAG: Mur ligase family protein [Patescibacteria group bacterium]